MRGGGERKKARPGVPLHLGVGRAIIARVGPCGRGADHLPRDLAPQLPDPGFHRAADFRSSAAIPGGRLSEPAFGWDQSVFRRRVPNGEVREKTDRSNKGSMRVPLSCTAAVGHEKMCALPTARRPGSMRQRYGGAKALSRGRSIFSTNRGKNAPSYYIRQLP